MPRTAEIFSSAIVAVGAFNPAIFSPDWLEKNNLLGSEDADAARELKSLVVSHQVTVYETEWFALQILENQFSLTSKGALSLAFKDLAVGILTLVPHTPVTAIGLNFLGHYRLDSEADWHKFGDVLAPKQIWKELYSVEKYAAGIADLTMLIQEGQRGQEFKKGDERRISIQPSAKIKYGTFMSYNDHRVVTANDADNKTAAESAAEIAARDWQSSWDDAVRVFDGLIAKALASNERRTA